MLGLWILAQAVAAPNQAAAIDAVTLPHVKRMSMKASAYPPAAAAAGQEGRVDYSVSIDARGRVTDCRITSGSGSAALDAETCRLPARDMVYEPARDAEGHPVAGELAMARTWKLPH